MANKYPFPPDFKTIYEKADLLKARTESLTKKLRAFEVIVFGRGSVVYAVTFLTPAFSLKR